VRSGDGVCRERHYLFVASEGPLIIELVGATRNNCRCPTSWDKNDPKCQFHKESAAQDAIDSWGQPAPVFSCPAAIFSGGTVFGGHSCGVRSDSGGVEWRSFHDDIENSEILARPFAARTPVDTAVRHRRRKPYRRSTSRTGSQRRSGPGMMGILTHEIHCGTGAPAARSDWTQFENYAGHQLNFRHGNRRVNEITGNLPIVCGSITYFVKRERATGV